MLDQCCTNIRGYELHTLCRLILQVRSNFILPRLSRLTPGRDENIGISDILQRLEGDIYDLYFCCLLDIVSTISNKVCVELQF